MQNCEVIKPKIVKKAYVCKQVFMISPFKRIFSITPADYLDSVCSDINHDFEIIEESKTHTTVKVQNTIKTLKNLKNDFRPPELRPCFLKLEKYKNLSKLDRRLGLIENKMKFQGVSEPSTNDCSSTENWVTDEEFRLKTYMTSWEGVHTRPPQLVMKNYHK